jgi:glycosyltransferase involved in cell wall biosynthesis
VKIALVGTYAASGGASTVLRAQAGLLVKAGHEVTVFHHDRVERPLPGVASRPIPNPYTLDRRTARQVEDALLEGAYDVAHWHLVTTLNDVSILDRVRAQVPLAITPHSHIYSCPAVKKLRRRPLSACPRVIGPGCFVSAYRHGCAARRPWRAAREYVRCLDNIGSARRADALIVTCKYMAETLTAVGIPAERTHIVRPVVPVGPLSTAGGASPPIVLLAGRLIEEKGAHCLLNASHRMRVQHQLWIAGEGPQRRLLEEQARDRGQNVRFLGWLSAAELVDAVARAQVVAMPSLCPETLGVAGLEAHAYSKPVVAFDSGGISNWLHDGQNGFLVPPRDVDTLAARLDQLLADPERCKEMGARGRAQVAREYAPAAHLKDVLTAYQAAIRTHMDKR